MRNYLQKIFIASAAFLLASGAGVALAAFPPSNTFQGGTGTTTPSGILSGDNGTTNHLSSVVIGSGLQYTSNTLSTTGVGSGITDIGSGFATTTQAKQTFGTTTVTVNGLTYGIQIVPTSPSTGLITFTPTISGTYSGQAGSVANAHTVSGSLTGSSFNGSSAISDWAVNMANSNWFTARQNFTNATSSGLEATSTNVYFDGYTSAILTASAGHQLTAYAGSAPCTNQVALSLSALGVITCTSINNAYWSGTALAEGNGGTNATSLGANMILVNNGASTVVASSTPTAASYNATSTSLASVFPYASSTGITTSGELVIPNSTSKGSAIAGQLELDTTDDQLKAGDGSATAVFDQRRMYSFGIATSTWTGSTTAQNLAPFPLAGTIKSIACTVLPQAASLGVDWYYGGTPTHLAYIPTASSTANTFTFTTNNTPAANASSTVVFGTPVSSPTSISCTALFTITGT